MPAPLSSQFSPLSLSPIQYMYSEEVMSDIIQNMLDPRVPTHVKYFTTLNFIIWAIFGTSFGADFEIFIPGKVITAACMLVGFGYNIYCLISILSIMNIAYAPRTKYYEVINQLDAYMRKKQFPMHLQLRIKYFYKKKFRRSHYRERDILDFLSGERRDIGFCNFRARSWLKITKRCKATVAISHEMMSHDTMLYTTHFVTCELHEMMSHDTFCRITRHNVVHDKSTSLSDRNLRSRDNHDEIASQ
jgi:hypothetical protein